MTTDSEKCRRGFSMPAPTFYSGFWSTS
jgi:hypothetical protein